MKVEVTVPAVPNIGTVAPSPAPADLGGSSRGVVYYVAWDEATRGMRSEQSRNDRHR